MSPPVGLGSLTPVICARCGHQNPEDARFCSSCGAPLAAGDSEETTLTLSAVEAATEDDELERYLDGLAPGLGMLVVRHGPNAGSSYRLEAPVTTIGRHPESDIFLDDITQTVLREVGDADAGHAAVQPHPLVLAAVSKILGNVHGFGA